MRLDRFTTTPRRQKYALVKMREVERHAKEETVHAKPIRHALQVLRDAGVLDFGDTPETEFFVIRLKDKNAYGALEEYSSAAYRHGDFELCRDVWALAQLARDYPNPEMPT